MGKTKKRKIKPFQKDVGFSRSVNKHFSNSIVVSIALLILLLMTTYFRNIIWKDGIIMWEDVIKKSPKKARGHDALGRLYEKQDQLDEAIKEYLTAISINPYYHDVHVNMGNLYADKSMLDEAIKEYLIALRLQPDNAGNHNNLGNAYADKGLLDEAIKEYETAIRLKPDYADAHYNLGAVYYEKGRFDDAKREYLIASELKPSLRELYKKDKSLKDKAEMNLKQYEKIKP